MAAPILERELGMKKGIEGIRNQKEKRYLKMGFSVSFVCIVLFSIFHVMVSSVPGTFAWFTSETSTTGTVQNANTADLLTIQASEVTYDENCSVSNVLSIKNISELDTTVNVSVVTNEGEKLLKEQHLNPNETLVTSPEELTAILANVCSTDHIEYRIHAFINFVDESFIVAVDPTKMKVMPPANNESDIIEESEKQTDEIEQVEEQPNSLVEESQVPEKIGN